MSAAATVASSAAIPQIQVPEIQRIIRGFVRFFATSVKPTPGAWADGAICL
jgi:hypothetical protein